MCIRPRRYPLFFGVSEGSPRIAVRRTRCERCLLHSCATGLRVQDVAFVVHEPISNYFCSSEQFETAAELGPRRLSGWWLSRLSPTVSSRRFCSCSFLRALTSTVHSCCTSSAGPIRRSTSLATVRAGSSFPLPPLSPLVPLTKLATMLRSGAHTRFVKVVARATNQTVIEGAGLKVRRAMAEESGGAEAEAAAAAIMEMESCTSLNSPLFIQRDC